MFKLFNRSPIIEVTYSEYAYELIKSTEKSVGYDVRSPETFLLFSNTPKLVKTGIFLKMPDNIECQVRSRSGLALKGISVANSPGTIDPDYEGELGIILINHKQLLERINTGDKIAQLVFNEIIRPKFKGNIIEKNKIRKDGGFGSTDQS